MRMSSTIISEELKAESGSQREERLTGTIVCERSGGVVRILLRPTEEDAPDIEILETETSNNEDFEGNFLIRWSSETLEIAIAFAIDKQKYHRALRKHGVQLTGNAEYAMTRQSRETKRA